METTKNCESLMTFLLNNNCISFITQKPKTKQILLSLYNEITKANKYIKKEKVSNPDFYNLKIKRILSESDIPKPATFTERSVVKLIDAHIKSFSYYSLTYSFQLLNRDITIYFVLEKTGVDENLDLEPDIRKFNKYVDNMLLWLYIIDKQSTSKCGSNVSIFVYMTSLKKELPEVDNVTLSQIHVNTAFTTSCPVDLSEIVIYREEEWFKVFLHETMHNFNLDFSGMSIKYCQDKMMNLFHIKMKTALYEAYAEFWAKIMNILMFSYHVMNDHNKDNKDEKYNFKTFLRYAEFLMNYERMHCYFQMVKVLKYNKLTYEELYSDMRKTNDYNENTNAFAYYVITLILISNYPEFLEWCYDNNSNTNIMQFSHTNQNQISFCQYIESQYKNKQLLKNVKCTEKLLLKITAEKANIAKHKTKTKKQKNELMQLNYALTNLRLSLCEMQ